jgi:arginine decarboxylase
MRNVLDLHSPSSKPYYLGFFLVGAYQESLANEHNLFGAINEAEIILKNDGKWDITKTTIGDPIEELLITRNYEIPLLWESFDRQLQLSLGNSLVGQDEAEHIKHQLKNYLAASPYLRENK